MMLCFRALQFVMVLSPSVNPPFHTSPLHLEASHYRAYDIVAPSPGLRSPLLLPATDDVLLSQPYNHDLINNAYQFSSGANWMIAEDIHLNEDCILQTVEFWAAFTNPVLPTTYNLGILHDTGSGPGGAFLWYSPESDLVYEDFDEFYGYTVWRVVITLSEQVVLPGPGIYWLSMQAVIGGIDAYLFMANNQPGWYEQAYVTSNNGNTWNTCHARFGFVGGAFLILYGETTALERCTWGGIKSLF
jgi:hypothetical protein